MFLSKLTGAVAASAIALTMMTATASPARADDDTIRQLGGIAAIALGAKIIHDNRQERRSADRERERNEQRWNHRRDDDDHRRNRDWNRGRHQEARLPERCIRDYDRRRGEVIAVYDEDCIRQHARR